jgi:hypothetical protein
MITFYLPLPVLDRRPELNDCINKLTTSIVVRQIISEDKSPLICSTNDTIEVQHNEYIQRKFFNTRLCRFGGPLYIWRKHPTQIHLSKPGYTNGKKVEPLNVTLNASTNEQFEGLFHIIEFSYWSKKSSKQILNWIAHNYNTLVGLQLRVIRLPEVTKNGKLAPGYPPIPETSSLLCLGANSQGSFRRSTGTVRHKYYIWNGPNKDVAKALINIRDNYLKTKSITELLGQLNDTYIREIGVIVTRIEGHVNTPINLPLNDSEEEESNALTDNTTDASDSDSYEEDIESQPLTAEGIIHQLGPDRARDLAVSIIALTHKPI